MCYTKENNCDFPYMMEIIYEGDIQMDKQQFNMSIQEADNSSLRIGAANRIVQLLEKQRYSNNENSAKRWVWELCQNAKDVCNFSGKVKISIDYDEGQSKVLFRHNGKAFSMANILSLINQTSSKDRDGGSERKSGKFGTGFITTHLLSEIVNISGILEAGSEYSKVNITLDRRGKEKNEIITAMEKAVSDLEKCTSIDIFDYNEDEYNTEFKYELDEYGMQTARDGLENLRESAPFVLAMLPEIEEITVENTGERFQYKREIKCKLEKATVSEIEIEKNGQLNFKYVLRVTQDKVSILIALECIETKKKIVPFSKYQSKLFCDFPLIGTEDFPFPVVISSPDFNPTEPRDGVFLICKNRARIDDEIEVNRNIIETACELYQQLLEYAAKKKWDGIYNITKICSYSKKDWFDEEWLKEIIEKSKNAILHTSIVCTANGTMKALLDDRDGEQVFIASDRNESVRERIWQLLCYSMPDKIPKREDLHEWYHSLWPGCNKYTFESLSDRVNEYRNIETLEDELSELGWKEWLNNYYNLIDENEKWQEYVKNRQLSILPNQNGVFCNVGKLHIDVDILEEYKDILMDLGEDVKAELLHLDIGCRKWFQCAEANNKQTLEQIERYLNEADGVVRGKVYLKIAYMYNDSFQNVNEQKQICNYADRILKLDLRMQEVEEISEKLLQEAMKYTVTSIADKISKCRTVDGLAEYLNCSKEVAVKYLAGFVEFVVKQGLDNLFNKVTKPILPNQNGDFLIKEKIFIDDEMDETLKEIACLASYDIRAELLMKEIYLKLPENRWKTNKDIAGCITQFVEDNRNTKDSVIRNVFNKLLLWINDNQSEAEKILPNLYKNKHYLYDDNEIAENIRQAETFTNIMSKYNIESPAQLEVIIRKNADSNPIESTSSKEMITREVLLQYGIDSEEALNKAFSNLDFANLFIRESKHDISTYEYVRRILERAQENILEYLEKQEGYDLSDKQKIADTIFVVRKNGKQIYMLARPSDGGEVRIYYRTEMDILDYSMDWELWVEDGKSIPQKITFGKMIKLTGLNRIPLNGR